MLRRPASLMPAPAARLAGFALLAALGALEWRRMVESVTTLRALVWVLAGVLAAGLLIGAARVTGRLRPAATVAAALGGLAAAVALSGVDLELFVRSSRWGGLGDGLVTGTDALGGAQLPYRGPDPWPGVTLALSGALLVTIAALIAFWPRGRRQGSPLGALIVLLTLVVTPVAALPGQPRPALGLAAAALTACFLFLERLPVRPGAGAVVLAVSALAIALPLGAAADRDEPFFDYKSFAESLGPVEPVTFNWNQGYGPIRWPRDGRELFRVKTSAPAYWKAEVLSDFDGERWRLTRRQDPDNEDPLFDLPPSWEARSSSWNRTARITLRRLQTDDVVGAGTILRVSDISRGVTASPIPGGWLASRELGRGDSYTVESHVPKPSTRQMRATNTGWDGLHANELELRLPFRAGAMEGSPRLPQPEPGSAPRYVGWAQLEFPAFGLAGPPVARYPLLDVTGDGRDAIRRSSYERTWRMVQRLRRGSETALDYVLRVNAFLRSDSFRYTEVPEQPPAEVPPLEFFLHDSRAGYCQHFAGAMALMLRMGGVPARVATGFTPGGLRKQQGEWIVRDIDAHAWVEVWFDDLGWVTFDPTPSATPARSQIAALDTSGVAVPAVGPAPDRETGPATRRPEGPTRDAAPGTATPTASASRGGGGGGAPWWLAALLPLVLAGAILARRRGVRGGAGDELDTAVLEVRRALARSGRSLEPDATLLQLERRFGGSAYLRGLTSLRYAARPAPPTGRDRAEFRRQLAEGLGWSGRARSWWAVPPRRIKLRRTPR